MKSPQKFNFSAFLTKIRRTLKKVVTNLFAQALIFSQTANVQHYSFHYTLQTTHYIGSQYLNKQLLLPLTILSSVPLIKYSNITTHYPRKMSLQYNFKIFYVLHSLIFRLCNSRPTVKTSTTVWQQPKLVYLSEKVNDYRLLELKLITYVSNLNMSTSWPDYLYPYMILRSTKLLDDVPPNHRDPRRCANR